MNCEKDIVYMNTIGQNTLIVRKKKGTRNYPEYIKAFDYLYTIETTGAYPITIEDQLSLMRFVCRNMVKPNERVRVTNIFKDAFLEEAKQARLKVEQG